MRFLRSGLLICFMVFILILPSWAQQTTGSQATQPVSDPQAIAVVQGSITALGGATAISQVQNWMFEAQTQGPHSNGNVGYMISTDTDAGSVPLANGTARPAPLIHSHFLGALVGAILLKESQNPEFSIIYGGSSVVDSHPVTIVIFALGQARLPAQIWSFDATNLPVRVDFRLPAEIGAKSSFPGTVELSDYRPVLGVLYPFRILSILPGSLPEVIVMQSLKPSAVASPNEFNDSAGDLR